MDFKTRFQGKISHISKDGAFDHVILSTEKMVPIGKGPVSGLSTPLDSTPKQFNDYANAVVTFQPPTKAQKPAAPSLDNIDTASLTSSINMRSSDEMSRQGPSSVQARHQPSSSKQLHTIDIVKDNIYLKGGTTMAEALLGNSQQTNIGSSSMSIAMRMKKHREAATGGV